MSKNFFEIVSNQIDTISNRKFAEIFGINSALDAKDIKTELIKELSFSKG